MLETISWKQYGLIVGAAIGLYYGWWLVKYAPTLGWQWLQSKEPKTAGRLAGLYIRSEVEETKSEKAGTEMGDEKKTAVAESGKTGAGTAMAEGDVAAGLREG